MDTQDLGNKQTSLTRLKNKLGWTIPATDETGFGYISTEVEDVDTILKYCKQFRTCIQAGGNVGIWPIALARKFETVYTAEPDAVNFEAMQINCKPFLPKMHLLNVAFGAEEKTGSIATGIEGNMGALYVKDGTDFNIITIDSLGIKNCDLLQLDVEGYEYLALKGAEETIRRCNPTICIEVNGLSHRVGKDDGELVALVQSFGYRIAATAHRDIIFVKE